MDDNNWLVVWNIWCISIYFSIQLGIVIPTDFHIFQRGWNHQPDLKMMVIRLLADKIIELNGWFSSKPCLMTPECNGYYNLKRCQFSDYFIYLITCFFWGAYRWWWHVMTEVNTFRTFTGNFLPYNCLNTYTCYTFMQFMHVCVVPLSSKIKTCHHMGLLEHRHPTNSLKSFLPQDVLHFGIFRSPIFGYKIN